MDLSERKLKILHAIVSDFIYSAEPVGSRTLSKKYDMGISPATIRNEMSDLEEMGYLTHPHTSAGRVPSDKAYRLYVNSLMEKYEIPDAEKEIVKHKLTTGLAELEKTIEHAAEILSELTSLTSFAMTPKQDDNKMKVINVLPVDERTIVLMIITETGRVSNTTLHIQESYDEDTLKFLSKVMTYNYKGKTLSDILKLDIIKDFQADIAAMSVLKNSIMPSFISVLEDMLNVDLYMEGITNIFSIPEYNDIERAKIFMEMIQKKKEFTNVLINRDSGIIVTIGQENTNDIMKDCSLITATYHINGQCVGKLGVIGPTRMKYDKVTSLIEFMSENLNNVFRIRDGRNEGEKGAEDDE